jgi:nucleotide-binding universal stress UspA family protein
MTVHQERRPVVLGLDPDDAERTALAWAADEAVRRGLPLRLVYAQGEPTIRVTEAALTPSWEQWNQALHTSGERLLTEAVAFAEDRHPALDVSALLAEGGVPWVLSEQARQAAMVVLGSRHLSAIRAAFTSASVALPVIAHATCPVVVLGAREHATGDPPYYVVGTDGSAGSTAALDLAFEEADLRGAALRVLYAWQPPLLGNAAEPRVPQEYHRLVAEAVSSRRAAHPDVRVHHEAVPGHPVHVLTDASADALGLIVGTRGLGGFTGMVLGSVSQGVLYHARCPVITVPHPGDDERP